MKLLLCALLVLSAACGSTAPHGFVIPSPSGNDRESLAAGRLTTERLVTRAQAELEAGHQAPGGPAERWVRWALTGAPEDPGALTVAARIAVAQGRRGDARTLYALAALRAGPAVADERAKNLAAFAQEELASGRAGRAAALIDELEGELPEPAKELRRERAEVHVGVARMWIDRGLREPARRELELATKLGSEAKDVAVRIEALDKSALQQGHAEAAYDTVAEWRGLTRWLMRFGRMEDVDWALGRARDADDDDRDNELLAGEVALAKAQLDVAKDAFLKSAERADEAAREQAVQAATEVLRSGGQRALAHEVARTAHERHPGDARLARLAVALATDERDVPIVKSLDDIASAFTREHPEAWARAFDWVYGIDGRSAPAATHVIESARAAGQTIGGKPIPDGPEAVRRLLGLQPERALRTKVEEALAPVLRGAGDAAASERAVRAVSAYASSPSDADPDRADILWGLYRQIEKGQRNEVKLALIEAWLAAAGTRADRSARAVLGEALLRLKRYPEAAAAFESSIDGAVSAPSALLAARFRGEDRWDEALRFYDRLHPSELDSEVLPELVRKSDARDEGRRAEAMARVLITRARGKELGAPKARTFADQLLDGHRPALAAELYEIVADTGDKSAGLYIGWLRASLRMGAEDQADRVANRYLGERSKSDQRPFDELAVVFADEGRLGRAIDLMHARLDATERIEANLMGPLADLLRRSGRLAELPALVERFVTADARNPQRAYQTGAQRLLEAGLLDDAKRLLEHGLEVRPRDQTLLSSALGVALAARDAGAVSTLAQRLFDATSVGSAVEVYERIINDVRAAGLPEVALVLADDALGRVPGSSRLLVARGKVHFYAGRPERAFADFAEAIARSSNGPTALGPADSTARDVSSQLEPVLDGARMPEMLAALEARAVAQAPGRADVVVPYGRALLAANKVDEAEQVFARFLADNDRGHAFVADAWFDYGRWRRALDHWSKGLDQVSDVDAPRVLGHIAFALAQIGEPERLDLFVRLYAQSLDGRKPALLPVAEAYEVVGRPADALTWLERADQETPTADVASALGKGYLARGDEPKAMAAFERAVARRAAEALPNQSSASFAGNALQPIVLLLIDHGRARAARELIARVEGRYGAAPVSRFLGARAALAEGDLAGALERVMTTPFPLWKANRDLLPGLRAVLEDLLAHGHVEAAMAVLERALDSGAERELLLARLRIGARSGHLAEAAQAGTRMWSEMAASGAWQIAEALANAGLPHVALPRVAESLTTTRGGPGLLRLGLAPIGAESDDALDRFIAGATIAREDVVERASLGLQLHLLGSPETDAGSGGAARAFEAFRPLLAVPPITPSGARNALIAAALSDDARRVAAALDIPASGQSDRVRALRGAAELFEQAALPEAALAAYDALALSDAGDGELVLDAIEVALIAGRDPKAWRERLPRMADQGDVTPRFEAELARRYLAVERADLVDEAGLARLPSGVQAAYRGVTNEPTVFRQVVDAWLAASVDEEDDRTRCAELALARVGVDRATTGADRWALEGLHCLGLDAADTDWSGPRSAQELALALTWFASGDAAARLSELKRRFPGPFERPALLVEAAISAGDVAGLRALFDAPLGMTLAARVRYATQALDALAWFERPAPSPELRATLEALAAELPANDPDAGELLVTSALLGPDGASGALAQAQMLRERMPGARRATLLVARMAARVPAERDKVDALLAAAVSAPRELPLGDFDGPSLTTSPSASARAPVEAAAADAAAARGQFERAARLYRRAIVDLDPNDKGRLGAWLLSRGDALERQGQREQAARAYGDAARRGTHGEAWGRAARARLARRTEAVDR